MRLSELKLIITQGEGSKLEFKRDRTAPQHMAKAITAFANMHGGTILVGVADDGSICGVQTENLQAWLMDTVIGKYTHPRILPEFEVIQAVDGKEVAVITIPPGVAKPYTVKIHGREQGYVRYGDTCQHASREQLARLFQSGGLLSAEKFPVHGSSIADLDRRRCREYFYDILNFSKEDNLEKLMLSHDFLVGEPPNYSCSCFCHALFARYPQRRFPQSGLRLTVYDGVDKTYGSKFDRLMDAPFVEYRGDNPADPIESALHCNIHFQEYCSQEIMREMTRTRVWDYPLEAIREVLTNALIHRDWTKSGYVRVVAYANRLEVISPGALPNGMTIEKIKMGQTTVRNPSAAQIFRNYGYLEQQGMGIRRKVIPLMQKENGKDPEFEESEDDFTVILRKGKSNVS